MEKLEINNYTNLEAGGDDNRKRKKKGRVGRDERRENQRREERVLPRRALLCVDTDSINA